MKKNTITLEENRISKKSLFFLYGFNEKINKLKEDHAFLKTAIQKILNSHQKREKTQFFNEIQSLLSFKEKCEAC